ncbi:hypothetical protein BV25DRAFT_1837425 [Artomyces pyxidatus]|uniref:Uncharacterized protein n=1 Tax=Artomyces pyxidatus TaxID=48021 RepID=A0ACB8T6Y2_9AGAM|nr:hypothetical protein BV25DRAFT_1837425 [Artomyces pyxidatus]
MYTRISNSPVDELDGLMSSMDLGSRRIPFKRDDHYHRSPGLFFPMEISIRVASRRRDHMRGFFAPTYVPPARWCSGGDEELARRRYPDLLGFSHHGHQLTLTTVAVVVSTTFVDSGGQPLPHVFSTFKPLYHDDALAIHQLLNHASRLPDEYESFQSVSLALRADRHLPDDTGDLSISFVPFPSVFDGRSGYDLNGDMPRISANQILPDDLVVYATKIQRFWIPQGDGTWRWTASLKLESVTLLQHATETDSPLMPTAVLHSDAGLGARSVKTAAFEFPVVSVRQALVAEFQSLWLPDIPERDRSQEDPRPSHSEVFETLQNSILQPLFTFWEIWRTLDGMFPLPFNIHCERRSQIQISGACASARKYILCLEETNATLHLIEAESVLVTVGIASKIGDVRQTVRYDMQSADPDCKAST